MNDEKIKNFHIEPISNNTEEISKKNLEDFLKKNKFVFSDFCLIFEGYRKKLKDKIDINESEFKQVSHQFNDAMDKFLEEIDDLPESQNIGKLLLEMLTYMQVAQSKNTRVHTRLHRIEMEKSEKKAGEGITEIQKLKDNIKNIYTGFISIIGVFLSIFTLISVNINFFGHFNKENNNIIDSIFLFILVNAITIISLITLVGLIYIIICLFNDKEIKYKWISSYLGPIVLLTLYYIIVA